MGICESQFGATRHPQYCSSKAVIANLSVQDQSGGIIVLLECTGNGLCFLREMKIAGMTILKNAALVVL